MQPMLIKSIVLVSVWAARPGSQLVGPGDTMDTANR